jgi:outer membrane immunogenic protein
MRKYVTAGLACFALAVASAAQAAPASSAYNWNGLYIGGNLGYSWGKWDSTGYVPNGSYSPSVNGILGGLQLGYNWQMSSRWLLGVEADIQITGESKSNDWTAPAVVSTVAGVPNIPAGAANNKWKFPWFGTLRGRIGYSPDNWLFYFTGGLAYGQTKSEVTAPGGVALSESSTRTGWTLGGGIEAPVAQRWTAKVEYLYVDLGSRIFFQNTVIPVDTKFHDHIIRIGVNYKLQ